MAILRIFRPALACLLLLLALSQEAPQEAPWKAPQEAPQDAPRDAKKGAKCKNPNVHSKFLFKRKIFHVVFVRDLRETGTPRAVTSSLVSRPQKSQESGLRLQLCKFDENDQSPFYCQSS